MKKIVKYYDKTFVCKAHPDGAGMGIISVYERKRPNWPIFKDSWCRDFSFFLVDYPTIDAAVLRAVSKEIESREEFQLTCDKWKRFEKEQDIIIGYKCQGE
jgi:hypothetical protein